MNADFIKKLLRTRHVNNEDVFIEECKVGASGGMGMDNHCYRLDAWAMKKSWTNPTTWGYEIKVSRGDFLNDNKWQNYLPYCSDFYFVCPNGLIDKSELPQEVGLIAVHGERLYTKKKAVRRNIVIPEGLYRYILMNRVAVTREYRNYKDLNYWQDMLEQAQGKKQLGWALKHKIGELVKGQRRDLERENEQLQNKIERYEAVDKFCAEHGINLGCNQWRLADHLKEKVIPKPAISLELRVALQSLQRQLNTADLALTECLNSANNTEETGS